MTCSAPGDGLLGRLETRRTAAPAARLPACSARGPAPISAVMCTSWPQAWQVPGLPEASPGRCARAREGRRCRRAGRPARWDCPHRCRQPGRWSAAPGGNAGLGELPARSRPWCGVPARLSSGWGECPGGWRSSGRRVATLARSAAYRGFHDVVSLGAVVEPPNPQRDRRPPRPARTGRPTRLDRCHRASPEHGTGGDRDAVGVAPPNVSNPRAARAARSSGKTEPTRTSRSGAAALPAATAGPRHRPFGELAPLPSLTVAAAACASQVIGRPRRPTKSITWEMKFAKPADRPRRRPTRAMDCSSHWRSGGRRRSG